MDITSQTTFSSVQATTAKLGSKIKIHVTIDHTHTYAQTNTPASIFTTIRDQGRICCTLHMLWSSWKHHRPRGGQTCLYRDLTVPKAQLRLKAQVSSSPQTAGGYWNLVKCGDDNQPEESETL